MNATSDSTDTSWYIYTWGNNSTRARYKGKRCHILAEGTMNSVLVEFEDGEKTLTSRSDCVASWLAL
jgi:hypothetical protein